jgi:hypothetical protein
MKPFAQTILICALYLLAMTAGLVVCFQGVQL